MYQDIFKKNKRIPRKPGVLLVVSGGLIIVAAVIFAAMIWWHRPIVIVRISEFSLSSEVEKLNLGERIKNPDLSVSVPRIQGSLNIMIQNIGRSLAKNISLNFLPQRCKLGKLQIYKTDADCALNITPSTDSRLNPKLGSEGIDSQNLSYFISVKELRPGSEVQLKYAIYQEGEESPVFKFSKISSSNARVRAFYYHQ